jgi:AraC-like DNA-binding protein
MPGSVRSGKRIGRTSTGADFPALSCGNFRTVGTAGDNAQVETVNEAVRVRPVAALRRYIAWYSGYRQAGVGPAVHRGMPSPYLTLIFTLDEPLTVAAHPDPAQRPGTFSTLAGGLHTSPAMITHDGWQLGIQVALSPLGARPLLGLPAGELASIDVPGSAVLGALAAEIRDRARAAGSWPARFAVVDDVLTAQLVRHRDRGGAVAPDVSPEVGLAWRELLRTGGRARIGGLTLETGWSARHLQGRLRTETGLTPKAAGRVIRFDRARRRMLRGGLARPGGLVLADLAAECGYYDQAHLDREFRALAGCSPSQWMAEEFRNVQAAFADGVPGS